MIGSNLMQNLSVIVESILGDRVRYNGIYRYRVYQMDGDRVQLQIVDKKLTGLPDIIPVDPWLGVSGVTHNLSGGSIVLVQFADGDPRYPVLTGFGPPGQGVFFLPQSTKVDAVQQINLGDPTDNVVKWSDFEVWAGQIKTSIDSIIVALNAVAGAIPFVIPTPPIAPPSPPLGAKSTKVKLQ